MRVIDAGINNIRTRPRAGAVVVDVVGSSTSVVRNAVQAPWRARLLDKAVDGEDGVFFDIFDLGVAVVGR